MVTFLYQILLSLLLLLLAHFLLEGKLSILLDIVLHLAPVLAHHVEVGKVSLPVLHQDLLLELLLYLVVGEGNSAHLGLTGSGPAPVQGQRVLAGEHFLVAAQVVLQVLVLVLQFAELLQFVLGFLLQQW